MTTSPEPAVDQVLKVVRELLGNPAIDPADDFFAAGGHSLLVVQVVRRLRRQHGLVLEPRAFGANAQIAALANACRLATPPGTEAGLPSQ